MSFDISAFMIGAIIGFIASLFGGVLSYRAYLKNKGDVAGNPKELFISIMMILVFVGIVALIGSIFSGTLIRAICMGMGVSAGFTLAFIILSGIYLITSPAD